MKDMQFMNESVYKAAHAFKEGILDRRSFLVMCGMAGVAASAVSVGDAPPSSTCTAGAIHLDINPDDDTNGCATAADNSLCLCIATDTWITLENPTG